MKTLDEWFKEEEKKLFDRIADLEARERELAMQYGDLHDKFVLATDYGKWSEPIALAGVKGCLDAAEEEQGRLFDRVAELEAENERLKQKEKDLTHTLTELLKDNERILKENERLKESRDYYRCYKQGWHKLFDDNEELKSKLSSAMEIITSILENEGLISNNCATDLQEYLDNYQQWLDDNKETT